MVFSLFTSGIPVFHTIHTFFGIVRGMFIIMTVADMFRPAMFVSLLPIQNLRIAPGDFSSISGEFRFRSRTLWRSDHHEYRLRRIILGRWKFCIISILILPLL
jgi:hypothetical protein